MEEEAERVATENAIKMEQEAAAKLKEAEEAKYDVIDGFDCRFHHVYSRRAAKAAKKK